MPNSAQMNLLESLIGSEGIYTSTIFESSKIDNGTKVLYMRRALENDCYDYNELLGKLYLITGTPEEINEWTELMRALKVINDIYCNNTVKYENLGLRSAHDHYFSRLGATDLQAFQQAITELITHEIETFSSGREAEINEQIQTRISRESTTGTSQWWQPKLDLPVEQINAWFQRQPGYDELSDELKVLILSDYINARSVFQVLNLTMTQCQMLGVEQFKYFMDNWVRLGMITKNDVLNINAEQLIALSQEDREDFVQNNINYSVSFSMFKRKTGDLFPLSEFFSLDSERRALFCTIVKGSLLFSVISKLPISIIDFFKLDLEFINTLQQHNMNCFLLIKCQYLQPAQLLQLPINEISWLCLHLNNIHDLIKNQVIFPNDLFALSSENRSFIIENAAALINLLAQNKLTRENLLALPYNELVHVLTKPESDDSIRQISRGTELKYSFFTQMPCSVSDQEMADSAFGQKNHLDESCTFRSIANSQI